jgi:hypothetical protein
VLALAPVSGSAAGRDESTSAHLSGDITPGFYSGDRRYDTEENFGTLRLEQRGDARFHSLRALGEAREFFERRDGGDTAYTFDWREGYLQFDPSERFRLRAGRQIVSWGTVDLMSPLEVVTPHRYGLLVPDLQGGTKTGANLAQARFVSGSFGTFELDFIPIFRPSQGQFRGVAIATEEFQRGPSTTGYGARWEHTLGRLDLGAVFFNGPDPHGNIGLGGPIPLGLLEYFRRIALTGIDGALSVGEHYTVRWEGAYTQVIGKTHSLGERMDDLTGVLGVEGEWNELRVLAQVFYKHVYDFNPDPFAGNPFAPFLAPVELLSRFFHLQLKENFGAVSLHPHYSIWDGKLDGEVLFLQALGDSSRSIRPKLSYSFSDHLKAAAGYEWFGGDSLGVLGPFQANKLVFTELTLYL